MSDNALPPEPEFQVRYNCKVRYFPDNQIKISCFSRPVYNPDKLPQKKKKKDDAKETMPRKKGALRTDNIKRAIDKAFEIGLANDFQYFVTLTLNKEKINRYDAKIIYPKLKVWLSNCVSRNAMDYILFPEYHEKKPWEETPAIHFHALMNAKGLNLLDSGRKTEEGQTIYNLQNWKYGFSTVIELDGRTAIVRYVTKYITSTPTPTSIPTPSAAPTSTPDIDTAVDTDVDIEADAKGSADISLEDLIGNSSDSDMQAPGDSVQTGDIEVTPKSPDEDIVVTPKE